MARENERERERKSVRVAARARARLLGICALLFGDKAQTSLFVSPLHVVALCVFSGQELSGSVERKLTVVLRES